MVNYKALNTIRECFAMDISDGTRDCDGCQFGTVDERIFCNRVNGVGRSVVCYVAWDFDFSEIVTVIVLHTKISYGGCIVI